MEKSELKQRFKELVPAALSNEETAKSELIRLTQNALFKFCILLGNNRESAEDLCQDVFIKAFRSLTQLSNPESFQSWIYQIAKNMFLDLKRSQKPTTHILPDEVGSGSAPEVMYQLQQILSQFEPEDRYLILLIELEEQSYKEAADMLNSTEDAIRSRIHRLRQEFQKKTK